MSVVSVLEGTTISVNTETGEQDENIQYLLKILTNDEHNDKTNACLFNIMKILKQFPPALNANKFIYGKLIEIALADLFKGCGFNVEDLDEKVSGNEGACYINDISIGGNGVKSDILFSIKAQKGGDIEKPTNQDITIVNKNSKNENNECYNISNTVCFIVMHISRKRLYMFRNTSEIKEKYITETGSQVKYKGKIFQELNEKRHYYQFNELTQEQYESIDKLEAVNPNKVLYEKYIVNN